MAVVGSIGNTQTGSCSCECSGTFRDCTGCCGRGKCELKSSDNKLLSRNSRASSKLELE
jgi:hypothetical protein